MGFMDSMVEHSDFVRRPDCGIAAQTAENSEQAGLLRQGERHHFFLLPARVRRSLCALCVLRGDSLSECAFNSPADAS